MQTGKYNRRKREPKRTEHKHWAHSPGPQIFKPKSFDGRCGFFSSVILNFWGWKYLAQILLYLIWAGHASWRTFVHGRQVETKRSYMIPQTMQCGTTRPGPRGPGAQHENTGDWFNAWWNNKGSLLGCHTNYHTCTEKSAYADTLPNNQTHLFQS